MGNNYVGPLLYTPTFPLTYLFTYRVCPHARTSVHIGPRPWLHMSEHQSDTLVTAVT